MLRHARVTHLSEDEPYVYCCAATHSLSILLAHQHQVPLNSSVICTLLCYNDVGLAESFQVPNLNI